jgi:hypothetical protein
MYRDLDEEIGEYVGRLISEMKARQTIDGEPLPIRHPVTGDHFEVDGWWTAVGEIIWKKSFSYYYRRRYIPAGELPKTPQAENDMVVITPDFVGHGHFQNEKNDTLEVTTAVPVTELDRLIDEVAMNANRNGWSHFQWPQTSQSVKDAIKNLKNFVLNK